MEKQVTQQDQQKLQLAILKKDVIDVVASKIQEYIINGELTLPAEYNVNNAIKSAWLILQQTYNKDKQPVLQTCTKNSIINSLLDMAVQGLNPRKKQCYFIAYGNVLTCERSYFGAMHIAKMVDKRIADFAFNVIYEGDVFEYVIDFGKKKIVKHEQKFENINKDKIKGAYCIAFDKDNNQLKTEIMTIDEIKQAWKQSVVRPVDDKGNIRDDTVHGKFTSEMCLKTVIKRCCKTLINASSDNALLLERINRNEEVVDEAMATIEIEEQKQEIQEISINEEEQPEQETEKQKTMPF